MNAWRSHGLLCFSHTRTMQIHRETNSTSDRECTAIFMHFSPICRTLNNNNLTWIGKDMFSNMFRLRTLRLNDNLLHCDCQLSWLARYLRHSPRLAQYTRCHSPNHLKGQSIADLQDHEFKCSGKHLLQK